MPLFAKIPNLTPRRKADADEANSQLGGVPSLQSQQANSSDADAARGSVMLRGSFMRGSTADFYNERAWYLAQLEALKKLQSAFRRRRWRVVLSGKIPLIHGPCGAKAFPIYRGSELEGMEGPSGRQYRHTSLCCLTPSHALRVQSVFLVESAWFERVSLLAVLLNCAMLAVQGPPGQSASGWINADAHASLEFAFTLLFTVELVCRSAAMGFAGHEWSYLSVGWNRLDCLVVVTSWLPLLFPSLDNYSGMRAVRALRPLRTINRLPGMRRQVNTLIESLPHLLDIAMLSGFILVVFGVLGLQLFKGTLRLRCYDDADGGAAYALGRARPLDPLGRSPVGVCHANVAGGQGSCEPGQACRLYDHNPLHDTVSFDNIVAAWMTIFQCTTLEGWTDVLYMSSQSAGTIAGLFFVSLVVIGAFYIPNLFLAVLWHIYQRSGHRPEAKAWQGRHALRSAVATAEVGLWLHTHGADHVTRGADLGRPPWSAEEQWRDYLGRLRRGVGRVVSSSFFSALTTGLILVNVALLMGEKQPMDPTRAARLEQANFVRACHRLPSIAIEYR